MAKHFSHHMLKTFHICKWIPFAILLFVSVEETRSVSTKEFVKLESSGTIFGLLAILTLFFSQN